MSDTTIFIPSFDRPLQLEGLLHCLQLYCGDVGSAKVKVLYRVSDKKFQEAYIKLANEYSRYGVSFIKEHDFRNDLIVEALDSDYVLFLVDDTLFTDKFYLADARYLLEDNENLLAFSYRLGNNITYCYPMRCSQRRPAFFPLGDGFYQSNWNFGQYDWGYPYDISSTMYRTDDIRYIAEKITFQNPNQFEAVLDAVKTVVHQDKKFIGCYPTSIAFANAVNKVQSVAPNNRAGTNIENSPSKLLTRFAKGDRINVEEFYKFIPDACHQEVEFKFIHGG
jgi:hypothetical protein